MKNYIKYICAFVLLMGMSVSAWGTTLHYGAGGSSTMTCTAPTALPGVDDVGEWGAMGLWMKSPVISTDVYPDYTEYYADNATNYSGEDDLYALYMHKTTFMYSTQPSSCTPYDITPDQTGTGTVVVDGSACEDVVVTFTATPGTGYAYGGATILGEVTEISLAAGDAKQFTMPGEDVILSVTFTAQSYDATLKPNGGSGSDQVVRVTYGEIPPTTLKVGGGAVVIPTRTGYDFDGYYDVSASTGGTQYYSYKGNPKTLTAEELWDKTNDANLFARWIAHTLTITLDKGTGGTNDGTAVVDYGTSALGDIDHATNSTTGYHLDGYYTLGGTKILEANGDFAADNITSYISDGNWIYDDDVTLYAHWALNTYTVHFNKNNNDATGSMDDQDFTYGTAQNLTSCGFSLAGKVFDGWATSAGGEKAYNNGAEVNNLTTTNEATVNLFAKWRDGSYTDYVFSCAELTLTPLLATTGTPIFITSTASKTVRSQDSILVVGNGLTPNTTLTYPGLPSKFAIKTRLGANLQTDVNGEINAVAYIFYTPDAGDETDGLDKLTGITVSVGGAKPKTATLTQDIIGRHLPADFVIAVKKNGKWYALPDTMTTTCNPQPIEITVDDADNPSIAYTANTNIFNLYGQVSEKIGDQAGYLYSDGHTVKLGMKNNASYANYPLFGSATGTTTIGKGGTATSVTNNIGKQYWWILKQFATDITNPQDAKYHLRSSNHAKALRIKDTPAQWGLYASGDSIVRLIPASASSVVPTEAEIVAWGKNEAIIEVDQPTIGATSVIGKLPGGIASSMITLSQTGTSVKGTGTRYNYTVNFGVGLDFSANEGKMLTLEWYNSIDVLVAVSNVTVPRIVANNTTLNSTNFTNKSVWNTEVHVLAGDTLTIDASGYSPNKDVTIKELNIYPGAAVIINTDTLKVTNLVLRSGWSRIGETFYGMGSLYIKPESGNGSMKATNAYLDWYIDYDQYYPIAVPWQVDTANIKYKNMTVATSAGLIVRSYDGQRHAKGGKDGDGNTNWKQLTWGSGGTMPASFVPGIGYAITARRPAGKAFSIIRMPLTIPSADWTKNGEQGVVSDVHKDQVSVTAWVKDEGETPKHAKGWNCIANPYMCMYEGAITHSEGEDYNIEYVNIPDVNFKEFDQVATDKAKLKPGSAFLIQTEETGTLTFGTSKRKTSAPSFLAQTPKASKQKAYITLSGEEVEDEMGLILSERYTEEYEINADLEKLLSDGNTLRTYMIYNDINMAYVAINEDLAKEWIPVTVRIPEAGEYTFSLHEASKISELEGVYLIDYETNTVTNLIESNYSFVAAEGTIDNRFAINAIVGRHETPTDIDIINAGGDINSDKPVKFIYNDKVFILHSGVIYDSTGKKVREINR